MQTVLGVWIEPKSLKLWTSTSFACSFMPLKYLQQRFALSLARFIQTATRWGLWFWGNKKSVSTEIYFSFYCLGKALVIYIFTLGALSRISQIMKIYGCIQQRFMQKYIPGLIKVELRNQCQIVDLHRMKSFAGSQIWSLSHWFCVNVCMYMFWQWTDGCRTPTDKLLNLQEQLRFDTYCKLAK